MANRRGTVSILQRWGIRSNIYSSIWYYIYANIDSTKWTQWVKRKIEQMDLGKKSGGGG